MIQHTQGEWHAIDSTSGVPNIRCYHPQGGESVLLFSNLSGAYGGNVGRERAMADLKLMAAAPELLEIALEMQNIFSNNDWHDDDLKNRVNAAIRKARGQS